MEVPHLSFHVLVALCAPVLIDATPVDPERHFCAVRNLSSRATAQALDRRNYEVKLAPLLVVRMQLCGSFRTLLAILGPGLLQTLDHHRVFAQVVLVDGISLDLSFGPRQLRPITFAIDTHLLVGRRSAHFAREPRHLWC